MKTTDLSKYKKNHEVGASKIKVVLWYALNYWLLNSSIPGSYWRVSLLSIFGAKIGIGVVVKPRVRVKYAWFLEIGKNSWIGEDVWIDNLVTVKIGDNVCLSQGSMLICGNHNYKEETFDLITGEIVLEDGVWIGARSVVTGGVICGSHSFLTVNSVATKNLEPYKIYRGNPAEIVKERIIE